MGGGGPWDVPPPPVGPPPTPAHSLPRYLWVPSALLDHDLKRTFAHFQERRVAVSNGKWGEEGVTWGGDVGGSHLHAAAVLAPPKWQRPAESRRLPRSLRAGQRGHQVNPVLGGAGGGGHCAWPHTGCSYPPHPPPGAWRCCWVLGAGRVCWLTPLSCPAPPTSSWHTSGCGRCACLVRGVGVTGGGVGGGRGPFSPSHSPLHPNQVQQLMRSGCQRWKGRGGWSTSGEVWGVQP